MDNILGTIMIFGFEFPPRAWAKCQGQLMSISQNSGLFSLLGTTYGGNGITTFGLPDLRGKVPVGEDGGNMVMGQMGGSEYVSLTVSNLPAHNHSVFGVSESGDTSSPLGSFLANSGALDKEFRTSGSKVLMNAEVMGLAGSSMPVSIMQPYLGLNFCICIEGYFPDRQ